MAFLEISRSVESFRLGAETEIHRFLFELCEETQSYKKQNKYVYGHLIKVYTLLEHLVAKSCTQISALMNVNVCVELFHQCRKWLVRTFCIGRVDA